MSIFHRVEERRSKTENRLPLGQSIVVIAGLSVVSWAVLIATIMGLLAVL